MRTRNHKSMLGSVLPLVSAIVAGIAILAASLASFGARSRARAMEAPDAMEVAAALDRVGITAETLAAVAGTDQQVADVVGLAVSHLDAQRFTALTQADEDVKGAEELRNDLASRVQGGNDSEQDVTALRAAEQTLEQAKVSRQGLLDALFAAASAGLGQQQVATLTRLRANAGLDLPMQYKVAERPPAEWVELREALANCRVNPRYGEDVDPDCSALVAQRDAEPAVAAAKSSLENRLPAVTLAFQQALGLSN